MGKGSLFFLFSLEVFWLRAFPQFPGGGSASPLERIHSNETGTEAFLHSDVNQPRWTKRIYSRQPSIEVLQMWLVLHP